MAFRAGIRFSAPIELSAEDRDRLRADGTYDPTSKADLRRLAQVAVDSLLDGWADQREGLNVEDDDPPEAWQ
jgi:hypothetical protein